MVKYKKIYIDHFGYDTSDWIGCEVCGFTAVDIHHIIFRSQGGEDTPSNLMALCRECHNKAHQHVYSREYLQKIHDKLL